MPEGDQFLREPPSSTATWRLGAEDVLPLPLLLGAGSSAAEEEAEGS